MTVVTTQADGFVAAQQFWSAYTDAVDRRDFEALEVIIGDGELWAPGREEPVRGGKAVSDLYRRILPASPHGHHLVTNPMVRQRSDVLQAACRYQFIGGQDLTVQVLGRYETELVHSEGHVKLRWHRITREFERDATSFGPVRDQ